MNNNNQTPPQNQPPSPQQYYYPDDEISLIDLWQTLSRRKLTLISVFVLVVVVAGIYLLVSKPVYESQAILQIGKTYNLVMNKDSIDDGQLIENINILKQRLLAEYSDVDKYIIKTIDANPEDTKGAIKVVVHAGSQDTAEESLEMIIRKLKLAHDARYREKIDRLKQREMSLLSDIRGYRRQLEELDLLIKRMQGNDAGHLALQMVNRGNMRDTVVNLEKELAETQSKLDESFKTHVVGELITKDNPVKPKPKLVIALSIVLGLMLGIFAAFFAEFIARARTSATGKEM